MSPSATLSSAERADLLAIANQSAVALVRAYGAVVLPVPIELDALRVEALVRVCGAHIRQRALDTPLLFSPLALGLSPDGCTSLLRTYLSLPSGLSTLSGLHPSPSARPRVPPPEQPIPPAFAQECAFANPVDLAALIKWAFSRIGNVVAVPASTTSAEGVPETLYVQHRGFLLLDIYSQWRATERRIGFPPHSFSLFASQLGANERRLLLTLFSLLSSAVSYSLKNGMTPSRLGRTFGPLLFGLPEDETFAATYAAYTKVGNAAEHLLLAYIREVGATSTLPVRLAQHVADYVPLVRDAPDFTQVQPHVKQEPLTVIESNVRLYSPDLIQTACQTPVKHCPEWQACLLDTDPYGRLPQLSARTCRLLNFTGGVQGAKPRSPLHPSSNITTGSLGLDLQQIQSLSGARTASSLSEVEWGSFASLGFEDTDSNKLRFDLTESLRTNRRDKHKTMVWSDFEHTGFLGDEENDLASILAFDAQLKSGLEERPDEREAIMRRLKEVTDRLPAFNYPTEPRIVSSPGSVGDAPSSFDPVFAEVWAEYLIGSGWSNRDDLLHRPANFVVLQYKSLKTRTSTSVGGWQDPEDADPRTEGAWFVISEVIPSGYRNELETFDRKREKSRSMLRKFSVFRRGKRPGSKEDMPGFPGSKSLRLDEPSIKVSDSTSFVRPLRPETSLSNEVSPIPSPRSVHSSLGLTLQKSAPSRSSHDFDPPLTGPEGRSTSRLTAGGTRLISAIKSRSTNGKSRYLFPLTPGQAGSTDQLPSSPRATPSPLGQHKSKVRHELAGVVSGMASVASRGRRPRKSSFSTVDFDIVSILETDPLIGPSSSSEDRWVDVQVKPPRSPQPSTASATPIPRPDIPKLTIDPSSAPERTATSSSPTPPTPQGSSSSPPTSVPTRYLVSPDSTSPAHAIGRARMTELRGRTPSPAASPKEGKGGATTPTPKTAELFAPTKVMSEEAQASADSDQLLSLNQPANMQHLPHPAFPTSPSEQPDDARQKGRASNGKPFPVRDDPFDKSRTAGRVARLTGQFGAATSAPASEPEVRASSLRPDSLVSDLGSSTSNPSPVLGKNARLYAAERVAATTSKDLDASRTEASELMEDFMQTDGSDSTIGASEQGEASEAPVVRRPAPLPLGSGLGLSGMTAASKTGATLVVPPSPSTLSATSSSSAGGMRPNSFEAPRQWRFTTDLPQDEQEQLMMFDEDEEDEPVFQERYQPGQPLHSLVEADEESLRSSVTSASLRLRALARR